MVYCVCVLCMCLFQVIKSNDGKETVTEYFGALVSLVICQRSEDTHLIKCKILGSSATPDLGMLLEPHMTLLAGYIHLSFRSVT